MPSIINLEGPQKAFYYYGCIVFNRNLCLVIMSAFVAELLRTEGMRAEHQGKENLVAYQARKVWLSCDCP